ncbi:MAG: HD domain-containing protein [Verrucomicrobiales bacterium]|nr:HD domain-containing protein [Verrucomicrobiales bacterium]
MPRDLPLAGAAIDVVRRLRDHGHEAFWVGGCVRDFLLGRTPGDIDVGTSARPEVIERLFARTVPVGRQFGVILVLHRGFSIEVATFRAETGYSDGRRPDRVEFVDARADAMRRDFTINGMFYDPIDGVLHDWVEGRRDLDSGIIRAIGVPGERFGEDRLRMLRAVRFATQLGFAVEPRTWEAIQGTAATIRGISAERIREELLRLLRPPGAARGLRLLHDSGLLRVILPEVEVFRGCEQGAEYHPEGDVFEHVCLMLDQLPADSPALLPWAVLLHDVGKPPTAQHEPGTGRIRFFGHERIGADMAETILRRLRFPVRELEQVTTAVRHHMQFKDAPRMRKATLRRMLLRPTFPLELELHRLDCLGSHGQLETWNFVRAAARELAAKPEVLPPLLTGHDLMTLGVAPGPEMGRLLAEVRDRQLGEELTAKEEALEWVRNCLRQA